MPKSEDNEMKKVQKADDRRGEKSYYIEQSSFNNEKKKI